jgi:formylglycine-generating enzyme required for sulfatase activity
MRAIPAGTFSMGRAGLVEPVHTVTVSPFFLDRAPVTQGAYAALMGTNPSADGGEADRPVDRVTWYDALLYCNARSKAEGRDTVYVYAGKRMRGGIGCDSLPGLEARFDRKGYRLPTEAEFEYAARAGSGARFAWGDSVDGRYCWYHANSGGHTRPVGRKLPNAFGLHDMAGNVWEWCWDRYAPYGPDAARDPHGPDTGSFRVLRGGSYYMYSPVILEPAFRFFLPAAPLLLPPKHRYGFRCAMTR